MQTAQTNQPEFVQIRVVLFNSARSSAHFLISRWFCSTSMWLFSIWTKFFAHFLINRWKDLLSSPSGTKTGVAVVCGKGGANIEIYTAEGVFVRSVAVGCSNGTPINLKQKPCVWGNRWPSAVTSSADLVFISDVSYLSWTLHWTSSGIENAGPLPRLPSAIGWRVTADITFLESSVG